MSVTGSEDPVFDADRPCFRVLWKLLDQGPEWLSPVISQLLHKGDTFSIVLWHSDPLRIIPRDNDLSMIPVLAAFVKVVGRIQDWRLLEFRSSTLSLR